MTISTTTNTTTALGNGATTVFTYNFYLPSASYMQVILTDSSGNVTTLTSTQYSVSGVGDATGGSVTYPLVGSPLASGWTITMTRVLPMVQSTALTNQDAFYPDTIESVFDYLTMLIQQSTTYTQATGIATYAEAIAGTNNTNTMTPLRVANAILNNVVSVKLFGAVGDGVTDDTAAIQRTIDYIAANYYGGTVYFPDGMYLCSATLLVSTNNISLYADTPDSSMITRASDYGVTVKFAKSSGILYGGGVRNLWFIDTNNSMTTATSPKHIQFDGCSRVVIENIWASEGPGMLDLLGCTSVFASHLFFFVSAGLPTGRSGLYIGATANANITTKYGGNIWISDSDFECGTAATSGNCRCDNGVLVVCVDGLWMKNVHVQFTEQADIRLTRTSGTYPLNNVFMDGMADICRGHGVLIDGTQLCERVVIAGQVSCASSGTAGFHGVYVTGTGGVKGLTIDATVDGWGGNGIFCDASNVSNVTVRPRNVVENGATYSGIRFDTGTRITITGGVAGSGTLAGVNLGASVSKVTVSGVTCTDNLSYGINIASGATDFVITGCNLTNNTTGPINDLSGDIIKMIKDNAGAPDIGPKPTVVNAATYTVLPTDESIIVTYNTGTCTLTLPSASTCYGRAIRIKTIVNQTTVSATSNVVPLVGGAADTAILAGTAGKWALIESNGTAWSIDQAG